MRCSLRLAMISVDEGVIPCGRGIGCSFTAPSPRNQLQTAMDYPLVQLLPTCFFLQSSRQLNQTYLSLLVLLHLFRDPQSYLRNKITGKSYKTTINILSKRIPNFLIFKILNLISETLSQPKKQTFAHKKNNVVWVHPELSA